MSQATPAGVAIRKARQLKRMTQQQLADAVGVDVSSVANWERGDHYPRRFAALVEQALEIELPEPVAS